MRRNSIRKSSINLLDPTGNGHGNGNGKRDNAHEISGPISDHKPVKKLTVTEMHKILRHQTSPLHSQNHQKEKKNMRSDSKSISPERKSRPNEALNRHHPSKRPSTRATVSQERFSPTHDTRYVARLCFSPSCFGILSFFFLLAFPLCFFLFGHPVDQIILVNENYCLFFPPQLFSPCLLYTTEIQ